MKLPAMPNAARRPAWRVLGPDSSKWWAGSFAGMLLGVIAYMLFAFQDTAIKWLVMDGATRPLPVWEVLCARSAFIVTASAAIGGTRVLERARRTPLKRKLIGRAVITLAAWLCYYSAARILPLAQLLTLYFAAPIMTTVLARPLLGEHIPPQRWIAVGVGFAGVVVACDPVGLQFSWPTLLVLIAAAFWGFGVILMRQIARQEGTLLQMLYTNSVFLIATAIASGWHSRIPAWGQLALLGVICLGGGLGQLALFEAVRRAPASVMAPVEYTALIWAFILGFVVFHDIPRDAVFVGAGLILIAGLLLVASEHGALRRQSARRVSTSPDHAS